MEVKEIISSGLLEIYISGLTSAEETVLVDQWVADYPEVKQELLAIQDALESYAQENAIQPDPGIKEKILARISQSTIEKVETRSFEPMHASEREKPYKHTVVRRMPQFSTYAAAASIILLIISAVVGYNYYSKYKDANDQLQVAQEELSTISNKYAHPVVLNGTTHAPEAMAKIYWMKDKGGEVWVDPSNLPQVPSGKQYQLWAIIDGKPIDAGMISTSKGMYHIQRMKSFGNVQAFAITMEKDGGSPTPDMDEMVVMSKI